MSVQLEFVLTDELVAEWVKALRSGDYEQGRWRLKNSTDNTYCCLGVLCEIAGEQFHAMDGGSLSEDLEQNHNTYERLGSALQHRWYEKNPDEEDSRTDVMSFLTEVNDALGACHYTFPQIADWIEENL